ncbi:MAG: SDR family oxidoreductase [Actinobacteria bacterium]|nr:SDR family oxidoreductase [Actinomycetota bacterium]
MATTIVTGGGSGIGRACALRQAALGERVLVWDRDGAAAERVAGEVRAAGGEAEAAELDVTDHDAFRAAIGAAPEPPAGLVHAAGVIRTIRLEDVEEAEYDRVLDVNLRAGFFLVQAVGEAMREAGGGAIVLFASISGRKGRSLAAPYAASKAGVISLTQSAALTYGPTVRVNAVSPGVIATGMSPQIARERHELLGTPLDDPYPGLAETLALKRLGEPDDVAAVAEFLLGPLSRYVTGQTINVDGGLEFD